MLMELSVENEQSHEYKSESFNPLCHSFVAPACENILSLADEFPGYAQRESLEDCLTGYLEYTYPLLIKKNPSVQEIAQWDKGLRARALVQLEQDCRECKHCELHLNSPCNVPKDTGLAPNPVFGEGAIDALVMVIGEGPGQQEARTGLPMVSSQELRASQCATSCQHFEPCFLNGEKFVHHVSRDCHFDSVEKLVGKDWAKMMPNRFKRRGELNTAGEMLSRVLAETELTRSAPHALRNLLIQWKISNPSIPPPVNVYVTNAVRHHATNEENKNRAPTNIEIKACGPWLAMTIRLVRPRTIVALGSVGLTSLSPTSAIKGITSLCPNDLSVKPMEIATKLHPFVFPAVHPAFIMKELDSQKRASYEKKLVQVFEYARTKAETL